MKAIVIDTEKQQIYEQEYSGNISQIHEAIDASCFCVATHIGSNNCKDWRGNKGLVDSVYVDDEGLLKPIMHGFSVPSSVSEHPFFAGKAFVVGVNLETGESCSANLPLEWYVRNIKMYDFLEIQRLIQKIISKTI